MCHALAGTMGRVTTLWMVSVTTPRISCVTRPRPRDVERAQDDPHPVVHHPAGRVSRQTEAVYWRSCTAISFRKTWVHMSRLMPSRTKTPTAATSALSSAPVAMLPSFLLSDSPSSCECSPWDPAGIADRCRNYSAATPRF